MRPKGHRSGLLVLFFAAGGVPVGLNACRPATQVKVDIRTFGIDCTKELRNVAIVVARDALSAEERMKGGVLTSEVKTCDAADRVGTLVITPDTDTGAIVVAASYSDARCEPPEYKGCVVARRRFSFIDHVGLTLPITLEASCRDVPCETFSSCRSGQCTSSKADCSADGTCTSPSEPIIGPDGKPIPPDGGEIVDGGGPNDDGGTDSGVDAGDGGTVMVGGNGCPAAQGSGSASAGPPGLDCYPQDCCAMSSYFCGNSIACMPYSRYTCTGRKHCGTEYCCAPAIQPGGLVSSCGITCDPPNVTLCNSDADCPPAKTCTGLYAMTGNGRMKKCLP